MSYWGGGGGYYQGGGGYNNQRAYNNPYNPGAQAQVTQHSGRRQRTGVPDNNTLYGYFQRVDLDDSGEIDAMELQRALSNGTWEPFNPETIRLMISMFDRKNKGTIDFHEFGSLWKYVSDWQATFQRFDTDNSGNIDKGELKRALTAFGYKLTDKFYDQVIKRFDRTRQGLLNFDDFIQMCIVLQTLTATFKEKDKDRRGTIRITYEDYLSMVIRSRI